MAFTTVHLMRHGEVDNPTGVLYGRLPGFGLTELGKEMAQCVADFLVEQKADITNVVASPLERAIESATPTALAYDLPIERNPGLIEADSVFEGQNLNRNRWMLAKPSNWKHYVAPMRPSWGEPYTEILARMTTVISGVIDEAMGHEALVVSHQLPIVTVQRFIQGKSLSHNPLKRQCSLASLTSLLFDEHTLIGWSYEEPAGKLLGRARDVTPGSSEAETNR